MLRSIKELYGYEVRTSEAVIGKVREFYLNEESWKVQSIGVSTTFDFGGREVRLPVELLEEADPASRSLFVQSDNEELKSLMDAPAPETSKRYAVRRFLGFRIHAQDGQVGAVDDLIVNDADFAIRYLTVDGPQGARFIVSPWWIKAVLWNRGDIFLRFNLEKILRSPKYDFQMPVSRHYESQLHEYYDKETYWA